MLDVYATEDLWQKIKQIWDNKTVIIVEHKVAHIWQHIDRVILFNYDGEIIGVASSIRAMSFYPFHYVLLW